MHTCARSAQRAGECFARTNSRYIACIGSELSSVAMRASHRPDLEPQRKCSSAHGPGLLSDWLCPPEGPEDLPDNTFP